MKIFGLKCSICENNFSEWYTFFQQSVRRKQGVPVHNRRDPHEEFHSGGKEKDPNEEFRSRGEKEDPNEEFRNSEYRCFSIDK